MKQHGAQTLGLATALLFAQAASALTAPPPARCADAAHAQFDFWAGEWDVYPNGSDKG